MHKALRGIHAHIKKLGKHSHVKKVTHHFHKHSKKYLAVNIIASLLFVAVSTIGVSSGNQAFADADISGDYGNDYTVAYGMSLGATPLDGEIATTGDVDFFTLNPNTSGLYSFVLENHTLSGSTISLIDSDGSTQLATSGSDISYNLTAATQYYVKVSAGVDDTGSYSMYVSQDDVETPSWSATAITADITAGNSLVRAISPAADLDYFKFSSDWASSSYTVSAERGSLTGYYIDVYYYNPGTFSYESVATGSLNTPLTFNVSPSTEYYVEVRGADVNDTGSYTLLASDAKAPNGIISTNDSATTANLSWNAVSGASTYYIYKRPTQNGAPVYLSSTNTTSFQDTGLSAETKYYYQVKTYLNANYYSSDVFGVTTSASGGSTAPLAFTSSGNAYDTVNLSWGTTYNVTGYEIFRSATLGGTYTSLIGTNQTSYADTDLDAETTYYYKIRSFLTSGEVTTYSDLTSAISAATIASNGPTGLTSTAVAVNSVTLSWNPISDPLGYYLYRKIDGGSWTEAWSGGANTTSIQNTGLIPNTTYYYKVKGMVSDYSSVYTVTTLDDTPTGLASTYPTSNQINLSWDTVPGAASYNVYKSTDGVNGSYSIMTASIGTTSTSDQSLTSNYEYCYYVIAYSTPTYSSPSTPVCATTTIEGGASNVPTGLSAGTATQTVIPFTWDAISGAYFTIYGSSTGENGAYTYWGSSATNSIEISNLTHGTTYYIKVSSTLGGSTSNFSSPSPGTTDGNGPNNFAVSYQTANEAVLSWDAVDGASGYSIVDSNGNTYAGLGAVTTHTITDLSPSTQYTFGIKAYVSASYTDVRSIQFTTSSAGGDNDVPTGLTSGVSSPNTTSSIYLSWETITGASYYNIYRSTTENGTYSLIGNSATTLFTDTGLTNNTTYYYKISSNKAGATSNLAAATPATTDNNGPHNLAATYTTQHEIALTWGAIDGAISYSIYKNDMVIGSSSTTSFTVDGLNPSTEYALKVQATVTPFTTDFSTPLNVTTLADGEVDTVLAAPTGLTSAANTETVINLSVDAVSGADFYSFYEYNSLSFTNTYLGSSVTPSFSHTGLTHGTTHQYKAKVIDSGYASGFSSVYSGTTVGNGPTGLISTAETINSISISWDALAGATSYNINRNGTPYTTSSTSYELSGLSPNTEYTIKVQATLSNATTSDWSENLVVSTVTNIPASLASSNPGETFLNLSWGAVPGVDSYAVYRSDSDNEFDNYTVIGTSYVPYFQDTGLTSNSGYWYQVRSYTNPSLSSPSLSFHTYTASAPGGSNAIKGLTSSGNTANEVNLYWGGVNGNTDYKVYRSSTSGGTYTYLGSSSLAVEDAYTDTAVASNSTYYYKVTATIGGSETTQSAYYAASTPAADAPIGLASSENTSSAINLSWTSYAGATGYVIARSTSQGGSYTNIGWPMGTTYQDTGLSASTTYYYKIKASTVTPPSYVSDYSDAISAATTAAISYVPTNLGYSTKSSSAITVTWTAVSGASNYEIQWSSDNVTYYWLASPSTNSYEHTGLSSNTTYYYKVRTLRSATYSDYSSPQGITTETSGGGDGNDTYATATSVSADAGGSASISPILDADWYSFVAPATSSYTFSVTDTTIAGHYITLYDSSGSTIIESGTLSSNVTFSAFSNFTYYLKVVGANGADTGSYTYLLSTNSSSLLADPTPSPAFSATGVSTSATITATFAESIGSPNATVNENTFYVSTSNGQSMVPITGTLSISGSVITFTPTVALSSNTVYQVTITPELVSALGHSLAANYSPSWSFTTASNNKHGDLSTMMTLGAITLPEVGELYINEGEAGAGARLKLKAGTHFNNSVITGWNGAIDMSYHTTTTDTRFSTKFNSMVMTRISYGSDAGDGTVAATVDLKDENENPMVSVVEIPFTSPSFDPATHQVWYADPESENYGQISACTGGQFTQGVSSDITNPENYTLGYRERCYKYTSTVVVVATTAHSDFYVGEPGGFAATSGTPGPDDTVAPDVSISVTFNESLNSETIDNNTISIVTNPGSVPVTGTVNFVSPDTLTFTPTTTPLAVGNYTLTVSSSLLAVTTGNHFATDESWNFTVSEGGGGGVPEFSTYMYILTLCMGAWMIQRKYGFEV